MSFSASLIQAITIVQLLSFIATCFLVYTAALAFYRLFLHPLRRFPGPKLAATSYWYEFYQDVVPNGGGQYYRKIERMHELYGPIVRITPDEVHIDDPDWFDVYAGQRGQVRDKYTPAARMSGTSLGVFASIDHNLHRSRRNAFESFFSKQAVRDLEPMIKAKVNLLCKSLQDQASRNGNDIVELCAPLLALGTDVVNQCAFGTSPRAELLPSIERQFQWQNTIYSFEDLIPVVKQFSWSLGLAKFFPSWMFRPFSTDLTTVTETHESAIKIAKQMIANTGMEHGDRKESYNVLETILRSALPPPEKSAARLADEGLELLAAGGEPISRTASTAIFHLLSNSTLLAKVQDELRSVCKVGFECVTVQMLEDSPWLNATIKEALRIATVISSRLPLISPRHEVLYGKWVIPAGTPFSMSPSSILRDPRCFKNPHDFEPERWLVLDKDFPPPTKYFAAFSRGSRNCMGINLAYAELYLILAALLSHFDMELHDTIRERDIEVSRDCFVGKPSHLSKGVHVKLRLHTENNNHTAEM